MIITKKDLVRRVKQHCKECDAVVDSKRGCGRSGCPLFPISHDQDPEQNDLFKICDSHLFIEAVVSAAEGFNGQAFFWSELRQRLDREPAQANWWGIATKSLKKHGFRIIPGARRSGFKCRKGGFDRCWQKVA